jgi:DNA-binding transcriptional LysR family regulator
MDLDAVEVFVKVVQARSFTRAARELSMPNTTVSSKIARLERRLGTTLLQRTTRKLHITPAGQAYFEHCVQGLDHIRAGEAELESKAREPGGMLRITASSDIAHTLLPPIIAALLNRYPKVGVELIITSRFVDLLAEGIDLAVRPGPLKDSSLIAQPFVSARAGLWATKYYLANHPPLEHPRDLPHHEFLVLRNSRSNAVVLSAGRKEFRISPKGRINADEPEMLKVFATMGLGIALLPDFLARTTANESKLIQVLPDWHWDGGRFWLVYPAQRFVAPKVRAFLEVVEANSKYGPSWHLLRPPAKRAALPHSARHGDD